MKSVRSKKIILFGIGILALLIAGPGLLYNLQKKGMETDRVFNTTTVKKGSIRLTVAETGSLEPVAVVDIKSEQSGEVKKLFVQSGDKVKAREPLAMIQLESNLARQAAQFRANVETERLTVLEAEREVNRQKALLEKGFIAQKEMETARINLENARIRFDLAKRQLFLLLGGNRTVYEAYLNRDLSSEVLDEFVITSPAGGTVLELNVEEGEIISSGTSNVTGGTTLMKIADLRKMLVKSKINEINIPQIRPGLPVEIRLDALPGKTYHGTVRNISPKGEKENNIVTYEVTMEINNSDENLMPSMTANVDIITRTLDGVLYIPLEALVPGVSEDQVHVLQGNRKMTRTVKILNKTDRLAIITEGIQEGETVILP